MGLIDTESLVLDYSGLINIAPNDFQGIAKYFYDQIQAKPTVDAVTVVRCKDCKHACKTSNKYGLACCMRGFAAKSDDFCSYGERRESNE